MSGQAGSGEVRSDQVRTSAILENPSGSWRGEGFTRHEGMGPALEIPSRSYRFSNGLFCCCSVCVFFVVLSYPLPLKFDLNFDGSWDRFPEGC